MFDRERQPVFFENVPVSQCRQCGEKYLDSGTIEKINTRLEEKDRKNWKEISVPVASF